MKWEYKVLAWATDKDYRINVNTLNRCGDAGWELVAFDRLFAFFKRPIAESVDPETTEARLMPADLVTTIL